MQDTQGYSLEPKDTGGKSLSINCLLTNNNFPLWIFKMKTVLDDENLIDISTDLETGVKQVKIISDPKKEKRAFRALTCNISEEVAGLIIHCQTAQEIWDTLMANYSGTSYARKLLGLQSLCSFRCKNADMRSNVAELRKVLTDTVVAAGSKSITFEEIATAMLINSLPTGFENARSQLTEKKVANLVAVEQKLIQEEEVLKVARQYADNSGFAGAAFGKGKCALQVASSATPRNIHQSKSAPPVALLTIAPRIQASVLTTTPQRIAYLWLKISNQMIDLSSLSLSKDRLSWQRRRLSAQSHMLDPQEARTHEPRHLHEEIFVGSLIAVHLNHLLVIKMSCTIILIIILK